MESDKEVLREIVSKRADKIQSEAMGQIKQVQERTEKELDRILPELMKQIENFSVFKLLDVLEIIRNGGVVRTCDYVNDHDHNYWNFTIASTDPFYDSTRQPKLAKGRYRITLIMEKLEEKEGC